MSKWITRENESAYKLSEESAGRLLEELINHYELEVPNDPEQEKILSVFFERLQKAYRRGALENKTDEKDGFCVVQTLKNGEKLIYRELKGKDRIAMEGFDNSQAYSRAYAVLGRLCGYGSPAIEKLAGQDWKTAEALAMFFFVV
jgi:hypothetical protein